MKAIRLNFESARQLQGECYLRFDDTNPATESQSCIESIIKDINALGYQPTKITYSSDYFPQIYEKAILLIKKGLAYVCECDSSELKEQRK